MVPVIFKWCIYPTRSLLSANDIAWPYINGRPLQCTYPYWLGYWYLWLLSAIYQLYHALSDRGKPEQLTNSVFGLFEKYLFHLLITYTLYLFVMCKLRKLGLNKCSINIIGILFLANTKNQPNYKGERWHCLPDVLW